MTTRPRIGVVGFGQMGQLMASALSQATDVVAYDPRPEAGADVPLPASLRRVALAEAAGCDIVFLFPPIDRIATCCRDLAAHLGAGTIVVEGCSVMMMPVEAMRAHLPAHLDLVACHPLFGPQSARGGLRGHKIVVSPVRTARLAEVTRLFAALELDVIELSPEAHDRAMARTQAIEQLVGRLLMRLDAGDEPIDVPGYKKLLEVRRLIEHDANDLFAAIVRENPFARAEVERVGRAFAELLRALGVEAPR
jgi:prephenate dehydrogenase